MPQPDASREHYRTLQRLQLILVMAGRRAWARMDPADFDRSWQAIASNLLLVAAAAQLAAAQSAVAYVPALLEETGQPNTPAAAVEPRAFAGVAADGRSLAGLLQGAVVRSKEAVRSRVVIGDDGLRHFLPGRPADQALAEGGRWLDALLQTTVTDAARGATQAEVAVRPDMGFVRRVNPPCCGRCAILAGRWYRYDAGFRRHPRCDCIPEPATEGNAHMLVTDPDVLFDTGLVHGLTKRERDRLAAGDDRHKVINETRDMWRARIAEQKVRAEGTAEERAARDQSARQGLEDLFAATRSRVDALNAMRSQGYIQ